MHAVVSWLLCYSCILIYSKEGTHIRTIALKGDTRGLAADQKGNLYMCIELKCLVCVYTEEGKLKLHLEMDSSTPQ